MGGKPMTSNLPAPPVNAPLMHGVLERLGLVVHVKTLLLADDFTADVTDLTCWVEWGTGPDETTVFVKAAFMRHPSHIPGAATRAAQDRAKFSVVRGRPFGTVLNDPLPD